MRSVLALLFALLLAGAAPAAERTVVVLVFDGVTPELFEHHEAPTLARLRSEGAWSHKLEPVFPTISLINGFSLSTGCWPEKHGIVTNLFLDPERGRYDHSRDADWLTGCEGLHVAAERQGVPSAALGWYGGSSETRGPLASVVEIEAHIPDAERAEQVALQLARTDAGRPRLVLAFFAGPDGPEHFHGIEAPETAAAVREMDAAVARVIEAIDASDHPAALLIATDHGMRAVTHLVNVPRLLHWHRIDATAVSTGTTSFLYFDGASPAEIDAAAEALSGYESFEVLRRDALPSYARIGTGPRVGELIVSAKPPYFIEDPSLWPWYLRWMARWGPRTAWAVPFLAATHGYPPEVEGMDGVFYAWGDGIARGRQVHEVRAIDLHPTAARLLGIEPGEPVDGRVARRFLR